jgi:hypothetical protein
LECWASLGHGDARLTLAPVFEHEWFGEDAWKLTFAIVE